MALQIDNPYLEFLGVQLVDWSQGYAEMHLEVVPRLANRIGKVQGGVMCTLLDAVGGYAGLFVAADEPPRRNMTLSLTTNFIASEQGKLLVARGFVERAGKSIYFARAEVKLDGELLLATGIGTFKYLRSF